MHRLHAGTYPPHHWGALAHHSTRLQPDADRTHTDSWGPERGHPRRPRARSTLATWRVQQELAKFHPGSMLSRTLQFLHMFSDAYLHFDADTLLCTPLTRTHIALVHCAPSLEAVFEYVFSRWLPEQAFHRSAARILNLHGDNRRQGSQACVFVCVCVWHLRDLVLAYAVALWQRRQRAAGSA